MCVSIKSKITDGDSAQANLDKQRLFNVYLNIDGIKSMILFW